ncbi:MAG: MFS transporter [Vulcanococcus sp.]
MGAQSEAQARSWRWWLQFPAPLRELAIVRLVAGFGAGGVLYLTPMVFHRLQFSASAVGVGLAVAALVGTLARFASGALLDQGRSCGVPVLLAGLCGASGDLLLLHTSHLPGYIAGQVLLGMAGGLYWPAVELAVPLCSPPLPSARGYALVRSADAAGVAGGTLAGAVQAALGQLRGIYLVDIGAVLVLVTLLLRRPLPATSGVGSEASRGRYLPMQLWVRPLLPLLGIALVATAIPALMQSALPLDLVRGGLTREAQPQHLSALVIWLQLGLLLLVQWPVGQALARRPVAVGLGLSLAMFSLGTTMLALSALLPQGMALVVLAQLPIALGEAAFLPTSTQAVVELSPARHGGLAMALFSQCFALSALISPLIAGLLLDSHRHGAWLWMLVAVTCLLSLRLVGLIRHRG